MTTIDTAERLLARGKRSGDLAVQASSALLAQLDTPLLDSYVDEDGFVEWEGLGIEDLSGGERVIYDLARNLAERGTWGVRLDGLWTLDLGYRRRVLDILARYLGVD